MQIQPTVTIPPAFSLSPGAQPNAMAGNTGELILSELHGRYSYQARNKNLFMAHAIVTAPVIYTTAAGTGGPLLWNGSLTVNAHILAVGFGITTVPTVAAALGLTGNSGQTVAPTTTTAIDSRSNGYIGGPASLVTPYRIGTPVNAGGFFLPFAQLHTGALTVDVAGFNWIDIGGSVVVPPNCWAAIAASATATTTVGSFALLWEEVPI